MTPMFGSNPLPRAMTKTQWIDRHELWPAERSLLAMPLYADFRRNPLVERLAGGAVRVFLPPWVYMNAAAKAQVVGVVASRMGITDPVACWRTSGAEPTVHIRSRPRVPERVVWSRVTDILTDCSPTRPLAGLGANGAPVFVDYEMDSPHVAVSGGSGAGKSVLVTSLLAQGLHHGAGAVVLDVKRHSLRAMFGLPGVLYARDIADVHAALVAAGEEVARRNIVADDPAAPSPPRLLVVAEEMNLMLLQLGWWWEKVREKSDPKTSPAVSALRAILFTGRAVNVNLLAVGQQLSARATGGGEARESMGARLLARATDNTWKMLCPQIPSPPARSRVPGRWHLVVGDDVTEVQVPFATDTEARAWAAAGRGRLPASWRVLGPSQVELAPDREKQLGPVLGRVLMGLRDALPGLPGPAMSLDALRKASQRDVRFPRPVENHRGQHLFDPDELAAWKTARDAARDLTRAGEPGEDRARSG